MRARRICAHLLVLGAFAFLAFNQITAQVYYGAITVAIYLLVTDISDRIKS